MTGVTALTLTATIGEDCTGLSVPTRCALPWKRRPFVLLLVCGGVFTHINPSGARLAGQRIDMTGYSLKKLVTREVAGTDAGVQVCAQTAANVFFAFRRVRSTS